MYSHFCIPTFVFPLCSQFLKICNLEQMASIWNSSYSFGESRSRLHPILEKTISTFPTWSYLTGILEIWQCAVGGMLFLHFFGHILLIPLIFFKLNLFEMNMLTESHDHRISTFWFEYYTFCKELFPISIWNKWFQFQTAVTVPEVNSYFISSSWETAQLGLQF